jgi:hypothetical protein
MKENIFYSLIVIKSRKKYMHNPINGIYIFIINIFFQNMSYMFDPYLLFMHDIQNIKFEAKLISITSRNRPPKYPIIAAIVHIHMYYLLCVTSKLRTGYHYDVH